MNLGWCVSGNGMAARAVHEAYLAGLLTSKLSAVMLDRPTGMVDYCLNNSIPFTISNPDDLQYDIISVRDRHSLDWLGLTFNRLLSPQVISAFNGRLFNLHLALLPKHPGMYPIRKALQSGDNEAGVTIHFVDAGMDTGPHIAQARCPIEPSDTEATLGRRLFVEGLPLVLQTVRSVETRQIVKLDGSERINSVDDDLLRFSRVYFRKIFEIEGQHEGHSK